MDPQILVPACQWTGAIVGVLGAYAVGCQTARHRFWGFTGFAVSNLALIVGFALMQAWPLLGMQALFLGTSIRGMITNSRMQAAAAVTVR